LAVSVKQCRRRTIVFAVCDIEPIVAWLMDGARSAPHPPQVLA
jgi:hypothetical protein